MRDDQRSTPGLGKSGGIDENRRFTGLSGCRRLLEQKLDAVAIESSPYFHPEQAAAVDVGKHVFLAKPGAVDVFGAKQVEASGRKATANNLCFLVDFQTRADEFSRSRAGRPFMEAGGTAFLAGPEQSEIAWLRVEATRLATGAWA